MLYFLGISLEEVSSRSFTKAVNSSFAKLGRFMYYAKQFRIGSTHLSTVHILARAVLTFLICYRHGCR